MAGVRILQYVMQQAGNLLMLVTAEVGNKTGHGYLKAEEGMAVPFRFWPSWVLAARAIALACRGVTRPSW